MSLTQPPAQGAPPPSQGQLGVWDTVAIIVGIVVGTSIFYVPGLIFAHVQTPWMGLVVWGLGGVLALVGAFCYAELATTYPRTGGDYVYLTMAFGPWAGFLFGWAQLMLVLTASIGAMAWVFAEFAVTLKFPNLALVLGVDASPEFLYAVLVVVVLTFINVVGVTLGKLTQNILTTSKVIGLAAILVAGFAWAQPGQWEPAQPPTASPWSFGALAIILVLYAYGGWNDAAFVAGEVRDPRRNIPRALILGVSFITLIYVLVNAAYLLGLGFDEARRLGEGVDPVPARLLERTPLGEHGAIAISIIIMISALGAVNGLIFTGARVYATLGADYRLFSWLGHWKPGRRAPAVALLLQMLIAIGLLALLGTPAGSQAIDDLMAWFGIESTGWRASGAFDALVAHTAPVFWFFFLLTGLSVFVLREKDPGLKRPFSVPFFPVTPLIFCSMCLYMLYRAMRYVEERAFLAFGVLWLGVLVYLLARMFGTSIPSASAMHRGADDTMPLPPAETTR